MLQLQKDAQESGGLDPELKTSILYIHLSFQNVAREGSECTTATNHLQLTCHPKALAPTAAYSSEVEYV